MSILAAIRALWTRRLPGIEIDDPVPAVNNVVPLRQPVVDHRVVAIKRVAAARLSRKEVTADMTTASADGRKIGYRCCPCRCSCW